MSDNELQQKEMEARRASLEVYSKKLREELDAQDSTLITVLDLMKERRTLAERFTTAVRDDHALSLVVSARKLLEVSTLELTRCVGVALECEQVIDEITRDLARVAHD